ncbi:MAG TPA: hypothetical protein VNS88_11975 [Nitrospiraceae bacterium]|nr:hypothetical protein [Nitrospiraceae bacterium]
MSDYTPSEVGMREFLNSEMLMHVVEHAARQIAFRAMVTAPIGSPLGDEHAGRYKASFHIRSHRFGGATRDRAEAIAYNDSPEAKYVEFGHRGEEPYHTLLRAAMELRW